jgi:D-alanine transaminase
MSRTVYVGGAYVPEEDAKVSIFDRSFLFGDGVYEVTSVIDGKLVDFDLHADRLDRSLGEMQMDWPCTRDELLSVHKELVRANAVEEGAVYMQVSRGSADRDFPFPAETPSLLVAFTQSRPLLDNPKAVSGVKVVSMPDLRWQRRDIKSTALLAQVLGKQKAMEAGAFEGWMIEDGLVTEGTSSTSYIVKDGVVVTRPLSNAVLAGVTRRTLLRLMEESDVTLDERAFSIDEAYAADEALLTSASTFVLPIVEIDGRKIGSGAPGPVARRLREIYVDEARRGGI